MEDCLLREVVYRTSRSSGPGGQHVNKTESRVELIWKPSESTCMDASAKALLLQRLSRRLSAEGTLQLASQKYRSQVRNREEVNRRFVALVEASLKPVKKRRSTRPTRASVQKRLDKKKRHGEIKQSRRKGFDQ